MEGDKVPPQTLGHKEDIGCLKLTRRKRSHHTKHFEKSMGDIDITLLRKCRRRKICSDEMLHDHKLQVERVEGEKSPIPNHKSPIIALPEPFSPNSNGKTLKPNHISIPTLDSPAAHTRLATRRQFEVCNENRTEKEDHVISGNPLETITLSKRKRGPTKMKTIAVDRQSRVKLVFNEYGQPIGDEFVGLASFLGPLLREVVLATL